MFVLTMILIISVFLLQHPFLTYPLSLSLLRKISGPKVVRRATPVVRPSVDIVFCALNEEKSIKAKIDNCLALKNGDPAINVRCYSDGSKDATAEIMRGYGDAIDATTSTERLGKSTGMNTLLGHSTADIVIFTDANTILKADAIDQVLTYFSDPEVGCVCGNLLYVNPEESATASVGTFYWRLEQWVKHLETDTGSTMGADGALFAIRRSLFNPVPADIIDDMYTSLSTIPAGYRIVQSDDFIAYERSVTHSGEEFRRKVRIACRAFNCHRILWPRIAGSSALNAYKYISHKFIRWLGGLWMILSALSFAAIVLLAGSILGGVLIVAGLGVIAAGHFGVLSPAAKLNEIGVSFLATTLGVWKSLRGERFQTWNVAATARPSSADTLLQTPDAK